MKKKTYLNYLENLKKELVNYKTGNDTYSIGELDFLFNRDSEGFFEENELTVFDHFSKITISTYFFSEHHCGVSIAPFMKIAGCGSLIPNIIGKIDLENTFEKLLKYVTSNNKSITLYYSQDKKKSYFQGIKHSTKNFKINGLDPKKNSHYKLLKDVFGEQLECGEFVIWYKDKEYRFEFGTNPFKALDADKNVFNKENKQIPEEDFYKDPSANTIFYPDINIKFINYDDMKQKIEILKEKLENENKQKY